MVTMQPPERVGAKSWKISYSSSLPTPTFYIYIDGVLAAETTQTEYVLSCEIGASFVVEVLDDPNTSPMQVFPGRLRLFWFYVDDAEYYRVDEYVGGEWLQRKRLPQADGYLQFESRFLEDGQTHTFRVVAVGENSNESTAKQFQVLLVRFPDVPDVGYSYNDTTKKLTITEN